MTVTGRPGLGRSVVIAIGLVAVLRGEAAGASGSSPGRQAEAYEAYSQAQQALLKRDYTEALELMERAAALDGAPELLLELAQLNYALNDLDRAGALADQVAAARPNLGEAQRLLADIAVGRARAGTDPEANLRRAVEHYRAALTSDPQDVSACQSLAELYLQTGNLEEAGTLLRGFGQSKTLDPSLSLLLGKVDVRTGRYDEAEEILTRLVGRSPGNLEAGDTLAALYEYQKKFDQAIAIYETLSQTGAPSAYVKGRLGSLNLRAGRFREAIALLEEAQRLEPNDTSNLLALAQSYEGAGESAAALSSYDRLIEKESGNVEARFYRARLQEKEGDSPAALAGFKEIIALSSGRGAVTDREAAILALCYSQVGLIEMDAHRFDAAAEAFTHALDAADEPGAELFLLLARADLDGGKMDDAEKAMMEGARRFPVDLDLKILRGEILMARGNLAGARETFKTILKDQKDSPEAYTRVSEVFLRRKHFDEGEAILKEGIRLHPEDDGLLFERGAVMERQGRLGEAERSLAKAIRINPKNAMALNYLGYMLADRGLKLKESVGYVERAVGLDPKNPSYLDSLGWAQFKLSLYEPAEKNLRDALRYDRTDPTILEHLGDLLMATGRAEEALKVWESALEHGHEEAAKVKEKMDRARATLKVRK
jgi:tetratricopeptide (TPR) repeat protein